MKSGLLRCLGNMAGSTASRVRVFVIVWLGQFVSRIGTGMTGFALGVWAYQRTGSVTAISIIALCSALPRVLAGPFAGALVDRWDRRLSMIVSDSAAALGTLILALLFLSGRIQFWHIWVVISAAALFSSLQWPAFSAMTTLLVPQRHLARAAGAVQMGQGAARILSPLLGGSLIVALGLGGILLIDLATFLIAVATLLLVRVPSPAADPQSRAAHGSLWREAMYGWTYLRRRRGLVALLALFAAINFSVGSVIVLVTPLVLNLSSALVLGTVLSLGSGGMLAGGALMTLWGGPDRKRVRSMTAFMAALGLCMSAMGMRPSLPLVAVALFGLMFLVPFINALNQSVWQMKVAPEVQGRVFAIRSMIAQSTVPLALVLAGPLADRVFEPAMAEGGALASTVGLCLGTGDGRGIGLLLCVLGILLSCSTAAVYLYPRFRFLEVEIPDIAEGAGSGMSE